MRGFVNMIHDFWCAVTGRCPVEEVKRDQLIIRWLEDQQLEAEESTQRIKDEYSQNVLEREILLRRLERRQRREAPPNV